MTLAFRAVALLVACSTLLAGPLTSRALAQQPAQPAKPELLPETLKPSDQTPSRIDAYDVGAGVANVVAIPGKAVLCTVGGAFALRLAITNHRTRSADLGDFMSAVAELAARRARRA